MELPFESILISLILFQNQRNIKGEISRDNLIKIIDKIIDNLIIDEDKEKFKNDLDIDYELELFVFKYGEFFTYDGEKIILDDETTNEELMEILEMEKEENKDDDSFLLDYIFDIICTDIDIIKLLNIKIRTDIYDYLLKLMKKYNKLYEKLRVVRNNGDKLEEEKIIKQIKELSLAKVILFFNMKNNLTADEYLDLYIYIDNIFENNSKLILDITDYPFIDFDANLNPFQKAIWLDLPLDIEMLIYKLDCEMLNTIKFSDSSYLKEYEFYLKYYYLLEKEIDSIADDEVKDRLIKVKYRLMEVLDFTFDSGLLMNRSEEKVNLKDSDLFFIGGVVYSFAIELLNGSTKSKYIDTMKMLFIKAYYDLTDDKILEEVIKEYNLNNENLLLDEERKKTRRREVTEEQMSVIFLF